MHIQVEGLPPEITEAGLQKLFEEFGTVQFVSIQRERLTRLSKGIGYVEMPDDEQALEAISSLDGTDIDELKISVKRSPRPAPVSEPAG